MMQWRWRWWWWWWWWRWGGGGSGGGGGDRSSGSDSGRGRGGGRRGPGHRLWLLIAAKLVHCHYGPKTIATMAQAPMHCPSAEFLNGYTGSRIVYTPVN